MGWLLSMKLLVLLVVLAAALDGGGKSGNQKSKALVPLRDCYFNCEWAQKKLVCLANGNRAGYCKCVYTEFRTFINNSQESCQKSYQTYKTFTVEINVQKFKFEEIKNLTTNMTSLKVVSLRTKVLETKAFYNITTLERLSISGKSIEATQKRTIYNLTNLRELSLTDTSLTHITLGTFEWLPKIESLNLSNNQIQYILNGEFIGLGMAKRLDLSFNKIRCISQQSFCGLKRLEQLNLQHNELTAINRGAFFAMWKLKDINLSYNKINHLSKWSFESANLTSLTLKGNKLSSLPEGLFIDNKNLSKLDLSDNHLIYITVNTTVPIKDALSSNLSRLLIHGNQFECNCHLAWVDPIKTNKSTSFFTRNELNNLECTKDNQTVYLSTYYIDTDVKKCKDKVKVLPVNTTLDDECTLRNYGPVPPDKPLWLKFVQERSCNDAYRNYEDYYVRNRIITPVITREPSTTREPYKPHNTSKSVTLLLDAVLTYIFILFLFFF